MKNKMKPNQRWRYLFLVIAFLAFSIQSFPYDFLVDGIYYKITNSTTCEVAVTLKSYSPGGRYESATIISDYEGDVIIPTSVVYNETTYSVTGIDDYAFDDSDVSSVSIPSTVKSIGNSAFAYCTLLTEIQIPSSVTSFGSSIFTGSGITNPIICGNILLYCPPSYEGEYHIPMGITELSGSAFSGCTKITSVIIPYGVTRLNPSTFFGCTSLENISIPSTLEYVAKSAFYGCSSLKECILPPTVKDIYQSAFAYCTSLESMVLPASMITSIDDYTFDYCQSLRNVVFPAGVTNIRLWAFSHTPHGDVNVYNFASSLQGQSEGPTGLYPSYIHVPVGWQSSSVYSPISGTLVYDLESISLLSISNTNLNLAEGESSTLSCTILPSTASVKTLHWSSNNTDVAIVDNNGKVTAIGTGSAIIKASTLDGSNLYRTCVVTVEHTPVYATSIEIDKTEISLRIGYTTKLTASISPSNVDNSSVVWTSSNSNVASVNTEGVVTAVNAGEANITAITADGTHLSANCKVTVNETNYLEVANTEIHKGGSFVLPINLNNTESITALQFEMALPAGITISKCQLTDRKGDDHTASYRKLANGNYQVTVISLSKAVFSGTEGAVVNLIMNVDENIAVGDYPINITNIELTTAATLAVNPADVTATLTVTNVKIGDVDGNGKVSITDAVAIVSHILGEDIDGFVAAAADVDGNGKITITDAVAVVDMILNGGSQSSNNLKKGTNVIADLGMKDVDPTQPWTTKSNGGSSGNKGNYGDYWKGVGQKYFFDYTDKNDRMFGNHEKGNTCMGFYGDGIDDNPDIYQIVKIPAGHYTIRVQAFYRDASSQQITECLTNYKNGQSKKNAWAYVDTYADETSATAGTAPIRSFTTAIRHIFDTDCTEKLCNWTPNGDDWRNDRSFTMDSDGGEGAGQAITYYYPNSITGASYYFKNGYYWNELDISLNQETYVRIGLRKTDYVAYDWLASSEWQIIYNGEPTEDLLGWSAE